MSLISPFPLARLIHKFACIPIGLDLNPPLSGLSLATAIRYTIMSFSSSEFWAVYLKVNWILGPKGSKLISGLVFQVTYNIGWSAKFCPTPGKSFMVTILCSDKCVWGPIPDSMRSWGDTTAPALRMMFSPSMKNVSPWETTSTPTAFGHFPLVSNTIFLTSTFALIVKFNLCLDSPKYPIAVDHLIPFGLFKGKGPTPVLPGALASSQKGCPASRHAFSKALDPGSQVFLGNLWQIIGPAFPWKSPGLSWKVVSVSILFK